MGKCLGIVNQKGGAGKSTTSIALVSWLTSELKARALLVDSDAQHSSSLWLSSMGDSIPCEVIGTADQLIESLDPFLKKFDYIVIDGPGSLAEVTRAILLLADLAIIPCQPTGLDIGSTYETVRLIQQARLIRKGEPAAVAFLSRAVKGTRLKEESKQLLAEMPDVKVLDTAIHQRQVTADSVGQQATVFSLRDRSATEAAREYRNLFKEIMSCLENH